MGSVMALLRADRLAGGVRFGLRERSHTASSAPFLISGMDSAAGAREAAMPKLLRARPPVDDTEERQVRKLAGSRHAPGDWIRRARMVARSWDGLRTSAIA